MKINTINNINYSTTKLNKRQNIKNNLITPAANNLNTSLSSGNVNFKGGGNCVIGTIAGLSLSAIATIMTGGLAAPLILGMAGCAAGAISESIKPEENDNSDRNDEVHDISQYL